MSKSLSEMSLDELWQLFPIILKEHNPEIAASYGELKKVLEKEYKHNRDGYTEAKTEFIEKWTAEARKDFRDKYLAEE
jgi:GrpB-like predicted nucleotidyltransferase (UPF0157 family)